MKILILIIFLLFTKFAYSQPAPINFEPDEKLQFILEKIPNGWSIEWRSDTLILKREGEVFSLYENKVNAPVNYETDEELGERVRSYGSKIEPKILVKTFPLWTPEKFAEANTHNNRIISQVNELQVEYDVVRLRRESPHSKTGYYFVPETGDDEDRIRQYQIKRRELERGLVNIPDYHSSQHSFFIISVNSAANDFVTIYPRSVSGESYIILGLFEEYLSMYR